MTLPAGKKDIDNMLSVQHSTIYEEGAPVIVRRRGCVLRVRLNSVPNERAVTSPIRIPAVGVSTDILAFLLGGELQII